MKMNENDLMQLKRKVDEAKTNLNVLKGQQVALMKQLKDNWECTTIKEAEKKLMGMDTELTKISSQIKKGLIELESKYDFDDN
jgi:hypothetical protein